MGRKLGKTPSQELKKLMGVYGADSLEALATTMKLPYGTVHNWYTRDSVPEKYILKAQMKTKNFADGHLLINKNDPKSDLQSSENMVREDIASYKVSPVAVPLYELVASAGKGNGLPEHQSIQALIHFAPSYMRRHFGRVGDGFAMLYVKGDSMQPTLWDGDEIVIDTRDRRVDRDGIYVVTVRSDLKVKRIQVKMDGSLVIKSDNAAYEPELIGVKQADEFKVEGRLVWPRLR
jgi:phage repressor protein C with HTH and peptisase S24 domain